MAKLRVFQSIKNNVWTLRFENDLEALSISDKQLMAKFGEPEIDLGGTFTTGGTFTLPNNLVKIVSGFPVTVEFDANTAPYSTTPQTKVEGYRDSIKTSFADALTALRAAHASDTFTSEQVYDNL